MDMTIDDIKALLASRDSGPGEQDVHAMRTQMAESTAPMVAKEDVTLGETQLGGVRTRTLVPATAVEGRALLYFHGGGYVIGSPETHLGLVSHIADAMGAAAWSADYRLGPEHPFPAAIDDGLATYRALLDAGTSPDQVIIAGDSAGGGTAVATAIAAREAGLPAAAGLALLSPWVNLANTGWSYETRAETDPMVSKDGLDWFATQYLNGAETGHPLASPIEADLSGLPPMLIQVGPDEVLLSDATTLAERAGAAQVAVTLEIWPKMIHVFQAFYPFLPESRGAIARIGEWSRERVG